MLLLSLLNTDWILVLYSSYTLSYSSRPANTSALPNAFTAVSKASKDAVRFWISFSILVFISEALSVCIICMFSDCPLSDCAFSDCIFSACGMASDAFCVLSDVPSALFFSICFCILNAAELFA